MILRKLLSFQKFEKYLDGHILGAWGHLDISTTFPKILFLIFKQLDFFVQKFNPFFLSIELCLIDFILFLNSHLFFFY